MSAIPPERRTVTPPWPAMVLTAGLGTRLGPLSGVRAKPALPVAGVPLAGRILRWLAAGGVRSAVLNLHHRPDTITAAIGDGDAYGVQVRYSWERTILGSAGGPARALPLLDADRFFLVNGDTLTDLNLAALATQHLETGAVVTMAVIANPDPLHYGGVSVGADGRVEGFTPPGPDNRGWHFIGVQAVESTIFASLSPDVPSETISRVYRDAIARSAGSVRAFVTDAGFSDIGTAADYLETCLALARHEGLGDTLIGARPAVGAGARLSRSVLWDDVVVGDAAVLDECVVADGVTVPGRTRLSRRVLTPRASHGPGPDEQFIGDVLVSPLDARGGERRWERTD